MTKTWLNDCDQRRYSNPKATLADLERRVDEVPDDLLPLWCGVTGSCLRLLFRYEEAHEALAEGLRIADASLDHSAAGDIHQRLFTLWWATPNYQRAFEETTAATARFTEAADQIGIAKALVARGIALNCLDRTNWADQCIDRALAILPEEANAARAAALLEKAKILFYKRERGTEALAMAIRAEHEAMDALNRAKGSWVAGKMMVGLGQIQEGTTRIGSAAEVLMDLAPNSGALAVLDLAGAFLAAGDTKSAHATLRSLSRVLPAINRKAARIAAVEMMNLGWAGKGLSLAVLSKARERLRRFF